MSFKGIPLNRSVYYRCDKIRRFIYLGNITCTTRTINSINVRTSHRSAPVLGGDNRIDRSHCSAEISWRRADTGIRIEPEPIWTLDRQARLEHAQEEGGAVRGIRNHIQISYTSTQWTLPTIVLATLAPALVGLAAATAVAIAVAIFLLTILALVAFLGFLRLLGIGTIRSHSIVTSLFRSTPITGRRAHFRRRVEPEVPGAHSHESVIVHAQEERPTSVRMAAERVIGTTDAHPELKRRRRVRCSAGRR